MKRVAFILFFVSLALTITNCTDNPVKPNEEVLSNQVETAVLELDHLAAAARLYRQDFGEDPTNIRVLRYYLSEFHPHYPEIDEYWTFKITADGHKLLSIQCESTPRNPLGYGQIISLDMMTGDYQGEVLEHITPELYQNLVWRFVDFQQWNLTCDGVNTDYERADLGKVMRTVNIGALALKQVQNAYYMYWEDYGEMPSNVDELFDLEYLWLDEPATYYWDFSLPTDEYPRGFTATPSATSNLAPTMTLTINTLGMFGTVYYSSFEGNAEHFLNPWLRDWLCGRIY